MTIQLILYVVYPTQLQSVMIDHPDEASISIVFNTQEADRLGQKSSVDLKASLDFVAIRSPVMRQLSSSKLPYTSSQLVETTLFFVGYRNITPED
ncbi:hypothetical protein PI124_g8356 [Phytophthora idaei]|nr:hypothetical protein PI124_g8356 [Phytophthora idaei]